MNEKMMKMLIAAQIVGANQLNQDDLDINDEMINKKFELISKLTDLIYEKYA